MHYDERGLIVQSDSCGGDQLHREGWFAVPFLLGYEMANDLANTRWVGKKDKISYSYPMAIQVLTDGGPLRRTWKDGPGPEGYKWTDPKDVSRDQVIPNITAAFLCQSVICKQWLRDFFWFFPNWDLCMPMHRNHLYRSTGDTPTAIGDLQLFWASKLVVWKIRKNPDDVDNLLNHLQLLILSELSRPTEGSRRAIQYLHSQLGIEGIMKSLRHYHRAESNGNPEMAEIYLPLVTDLVTLSLRSRTERIVP